MFSKYDIIVSTIEPPGNAEIIGIVSHYHPNQFTKMFFKEKLTHNAVINKIIEKLVDDAKDAGADAIYGLKIIMTPEPGAMVMDVLFNIYGTAVKLK